MAEFTPEELAFLIKIGQVKSDEKTNPSAKKKDEE
jgi:hypothetical protein